MPHCPLQTLQGHHRDDTGGGIDAPPPPPHQQRPAPATALIWTGPTAESLHIPRSQVEAVEEVSGSPTALIQSIGSRLRGSSAKSFVSSTSASTVRRSCRLIMIFICWLFDIVSPLQCYCKLCLA